ncbi:molybdenum cofactor biosynthesis protein MoaE [Chitinibacter fontanus]|uniref:Molybdopterin synthase catalytic subunit n=1 Tax=Chitinibacter fontanus TaxID=1737446 RepID=A0A7D5ZHW1_9NEIS|nr:molybdenum cofactor biosynthesis protein MoaE [Chitinibacter fontanus]QLI82169.1 molybdenum cofactor biosynthesis protein MoaE [Chitinibacter fontanus]
MDRVLIQEADFNVDVELEYAKKQGDVGAIVIFIGKVRDIAPASHANSIFLEHYSGMTEKVLSDLCSRAHARWDLSSITLIHRIGMLTRNDNIVLLITSSPHRKSAYESSQYIMDFLKTDAPFWKKEITESSSIWVEQKESDLISVKSWD